MNKSVIRVYNSWIFKYLCYTSHDYLKVCSQVFLHTVGKPCFSKIAHACIHICKWMQLSATQHSIAATINIVR